MDFVLTVKASVCVCVLNFGNGHIESWRGTTRKNKQLQSSKHLEARAGALVCVWHEMNLTYLVFHFLANGAVIYEYYHI